MADQRTPTTPNQQSPYGPFVEEIDYDEIEHIEVSCPDDKIESGSLIDFSPMISGDREGGVRDCVQGKMAQQLCGREIHRAGERT